MSWTGFDGSQRPRTVAHVAEFLVEMYVSRTDAGAVERGTGRTRVSATRLSAEGTPVHYLRSLFVPDDETCLLLYEAASAETRWLDVVHRTRLALGGASRLLGDNRRDSGVTESWRPGPSPSGAGLAARRADAARAARSGASAAAAFRAHCDSHGRPSSVPSAPPAADVVPRHRTQSIRPLAASAGRPLRASVVPRWRRPHPRDGSTSQAPGRIVVRGEFGGFAAAVPECEIAGLSGETHATTRVRDEAKMSACAARWPAVDDPRARRVRRRAVQLRQDDASRAVRAGPRRAGSSSYSRRSSRCGC